MRAFAHLLDRLILTPSRNTKRQIMVDYFKQTPDPDRGLAVAAITRDLKITNIKPAMLRTLVEERMDPVLYGMSYDYVGDMAETISLVWPTEPTEQSGPGPKNSRLSTIIEHLRTTSRSDAPKLTAELLNNLDITERWALLKLLTGGFRVGVSSRLVKQALADFGEKDITEIEELWHGLSIPYEDLFMWLEGRSAKPVNRIIAPFRSVMLAHPLQEPDYPKIDAASYAAEWKWDGIRVQAVGQGNIAKLYSRSGDDISHAFPDILNAIGFDGAIDGELLIKGEGDREENLWPVASFSALQQRLNRKTVSKKQLVSHPAFIRAYDLLQDGSENLRTLPFLQRRKRLETFIARFGNDRLDISPLVTFDTIDDLSKNRLCPPKPVIEGLMLKRWDSHYLSGRPKGLWFKWKKDPHLIDAVLMYAQRGHGKRSGLYSDYTFGVWKGVDDDQELVPVGKAYFGFTDEELKQIDKFVHDNTVDRFGPVRAVRADAMHGLVFEIAFEGLNRSSRHKSGVTMRFPRISRLRWDKPPHEADRLENLEVLLS